MIPLPLFVLALVPTIWVVDASNGPGTNFTNLPPAVAAAASGDTILVRAGSYAPFNVTGKALTILGAGASVTIVNLPTFTGLYQEARIAGVPAGATFYVSGIKFAPPPPGPPPLPSNGAMQVSGAGTKVVVTDCVLQAGLPYSGNAGPPGMWITDGAEVHASRCTFTGVPGQGGMSQHGGGPGVWMIGSPAVFVADGCTFTGGARTGGTGASSATGGPGVRVTGGAAALYRCSAYGGADLTSTQGGPGVVVESYQSVPGFLRATGTASDVFQGGPGVISPFPSSIPAIRAGAGAGAIVHGGITLVPGNASSPLTTGAVTLLAVPLPNVAMTGTPTPQGDLLASAPVTATFEGFVPGAPAVLLLDVAPIYLAPASPIVGPQLVSFPGAAWFEITLDASGVFETTFVPAVATPALVGVPFFTQFGVLDPSGSIRLSNGLIRVFRN